MKNLVVYGSLINKDELKKENISIDNIEIVKIYGFRRIFNQEPSHRLVNSINRAVLNIEAAEEESWFNAIVIKNLSLDYLNNLDIREKGYTRINLESNQVITYNNENIPDCIIYKGREVKHNDMILPNFDYLNICLNGVKSFEKEFFDDFLKTTYKNSKDGLTLI